MAREQGTTRQPARIRVSVGSPEPSDRVRIEQGRFGNNHHVRGDRLAISMRSRGSLWIAGNPPAACPSLRLIGSSAKPWPATAPGVSAAMTAAPGNLPNRYLVAISQAEAALMKTSFSGSAIAARAASDNAWSPASHHRNAWGVEQQTHGLEAPGDLAPSFPTLPAATARKTRVRPTAFPSVHRRRAWLSGDRHQLDDGFSTTRDDDLLPRFGAGDQARQMSLRNVYRDRLIHV